ncbi:MAG: hypothetical protein JWN79_1531 [Gemmatimonadetes bacterium]|jgi:acyl carrier protein|nr:hypothetical protein [Gemmatimonadota bacterium]
MTHTEALALVAEAVELDPSALAPEMRISDIEDWSSLTWLTLMSLVDEKLNTQLSAKEIKSFSTVGDVLAWLESKALAA